MRKILIFGDGLVMALDPVGFSPDYAIGDVRQDHEALVAHQRDFIRQSISCVNPEDRPIGENNLKVAGISTYLFKLNFLRKGRVYLMEK